MYLLLFWEGYCTDGRYDVQGLSILAVSLVAGVMLLDKRECTAWPHIHIYRGSRQVSTQHSTRPAGHYQKQQPSCSSYKPCFITWSPWKGASTLLRGLCLRLFYRCRGSLICACRVQFSPYRFGRFREEFFPCKGRTARVHVKNRTYSETNLAAAFHNLRLGIPQNFFLNFLPLATC